MKGGGMRNRIYLKDNATDGEITRIHNEYFSHWIRCGREGGTIYLEFNCELDVKPEGLPGVLKVERVPEPPEPSLPPWKRKP